MTSNESLPSVVFIQALTSCFSAIYTPLKTHDITVLSSPYVTHGLCTFLILLFGWLGCCSLIILLSNFEWVKKSKIQPLEKSHDPVLLALARRIVFRNWIFVAAQTLFAAPFLQYAFPLEAPFLSPTSSAIFFITWTVSNDFLFTIAHATYHEVPWLYKHVHKEHHTWKAPHVWMSHAMTFTEMTINGMSVMFWPLFHSLILCRPTHIYLVWLIQIVSQGIGCVEHSGYDALNPLGFINPKWLGGYVFSSTKHHDDHHKYFRGNYGGYFAFWDILMGTKINYKAA